MYPVKLISGNKTALLPLAMVSLMYRLVATKFSSMHATYRKNDSALLRMVVANSI
jgi:hypothetical protein